MNTEAIWTFITTQGIDFLFKLLAALAIWIIGRWVINKVVGFISRSMQRAGKIDATLGRYLESIIGALLTLLLILAILDVFGVQTTSFAALLAGAGLAIGAAWSGMLGNFAAGLFMQVLRPYKVGDFISAGGVIGTVKELGLFTTTIVTMDNVTTVVGNGKAFGDNIQNFSALPVRRVDCVAKVANSVNPLDAIARLKPVIRTRRLSKPLAQPATRYRKPRSPCHNAPRCRTDLPRFAHAGPMTAGLAPCSLTARGFLWSVAESLSL